MCLQKHGRYLSTDRALRCGKLYVSRARGFRRSVILGSKLQLLPTMGGWGGVRLNLRYS